MRKRSLAVMLALVGAGFAPTPWMGVANAQPKGNLMDVSGTMTTSHPQNPSGSSHKATAYTISMTAGQAYTLLLECVSPSADLDWPANDAYMYLLSPSGSIAAYNDDGGYMYQHSKGTSADYGASLINYTPQTSGTYTIICTTWAAGYSMSYRLLVDGPATNTGPRPGNGGTGTGTGTGGTGTGTGTGTGIPNVMTSPATPQVGELAPAALALSGSAQPLSRGTLSRDHRPSLVAAVLPTPCWVSSAPATGLAG